MFAPRTLKNPPIREAIYTITFKEPISQETLSNFLNTEFVKARFPTSLPGYRVDIKSSAEVDEKPRVIATQNPEGFALQQSVTNKNNRLIQLKPTFLSYHNLNKYDGWDIMIAELKTVWSEFCKAVGRQPLIELKVRNLNHIDLPLPFETGFGDYIKLLPSVPEGINAELAHFFLQIQNSDIEKRLQAVITETVLEVKPNQNKLKFLLDITVFKKEQFDCSGTEMWQSFDELRKFKDDIFFKCITEKTEKIFNE